MGNGWLRAECPGWWVSCRLVVRVEQCEGLLSCLPPGYLVYIYRPCLLFQAEGVCVLVETNYVLFAVSLATYEALV